jgi:glyoxylase-like metal-dependent hydrolase (beta-lactamase superfamily II)
MTLHCCLRHTVLTYALIIAAPAVAQEAVGVKAKPITVADGVYLLVGLDCNVLAVSGPQGILLVDNGSSENAEQLSEAIDKLGSGSVKIAINTHFHFDHVGANEQLSKDGAVIVAHQGVRRSMLAEMRMPDNTLGITFPTIPPYPQMALPVLTFADSLTVHFGGHDIELRYLPSAHSNADVAVFMRNTNVLHTGDLYLSNGFPLIDSPRGATVDGLIAALDDLINLIDDDTIVVPGHGPLSNRQELREYRNMISAARDRISTLIEEGKSLEEIVAADPTSGLYSRGPSWLSPKLFIWTVYLDLIRGQ